MFDGCEEINTLNIGESVTVIPAAAFKNLSGITTLILPSSVTTIGDKAFEGCSSLTEIYINATTPPTIGPHTFDNISPEAVFHIPHKTKSQYKEAWGKRNYKQKK